MLKIIHNLEKINQLNAIFVAKVQAYAPRIIEGITVTWRSNKRICTVQFLEKYELYCFHELNEVKLPKHLNFFVTSGLVKKKQISRNTQINFPAHPNSRSKGAFARDAENHTYILHNGMSQYLADFQIVEAFSSSNQKKQYALVGQLDAPDFINQLLYFVKKCEDIKDRR